MIVHEVNNEVSQATERMKVYITLHLQNEKTCFGRARIEPGIFNSITASPLATDKLDGE